MKLLIWTQYFWPEHFQINQLALGLRDSGVQVTVVTGKPNYPSGELFTGYKVKGIQHEDFHGVEVIRIPIRPRFKATPIDLLLNYLSFIISGYCLAPLALRKKKFDAVLVYAPSPLLQALPAVFISWFKKAPLILWVQDLWPESLETTGFVKNRCLLKLVEVPVRYIYKYSDSILIQSEAFRASITKLVRNSRKITFFPNSVEDLANADTSGLADPELIADITGNFAVVFAGNIGHAQSCETIVAAAQLLQDYPIKFYLIGSGSRASYLEEDIRNRNLLNVIMTGQLSSGMMSEIYSAASVLLVTLKDDSALSVTIPSKLQSYFSAGKPIIASLNGEAARLVDEAKAGISCPAEDVAALAQAVLAIFHMTPNERNRLGRNGYEYFKKHFHIHSRVKQLQTHMEVLIQKFNNE